MATVPTRFYDFQMTSPQKNDAADQNFDYMFKLLIIGNSAVGKTSFLFRLDNYFRVNAKEKKRVATFTFIIIINNL